MDERFATLLAKLHDRSAPSDERCDAGRALMELGDPRVEALLAVLGPDEPHPVRFEAVYVLGQLRDTRAFGPLSRILADPGEMADLRGLAAEQLGFFEGVDAVPVLVAAMDDPDPMVRFDAAFALGIVGDERAIDVLARHVGDAEHPYARDDSVGDRAQAALERIRSELTAPPAPR